MRSKRSNVPVAAEAWGASILPGAPFQQAAAPAFETVQPGHIVPPVPHAPAMPAPALPIMQPPPQSDGFPSRFGGEVPPFGATQFGAVPPRFGGEVPPFGATQFGAVPPQFGGPPQGFAPQPFPYAGPPGYPAPPARRVSALWIVLGVVGGFVVIAILAAIAIPVFLSQRAKPANRSVSIPQSIAGQSQVQTPELAAAASKATAAMQSPGVPWGQVNGAYFGTGGLPTFFVAAAKVTTRPTAADESVLFASLGRNQQVALTPVGAGPFGGRVECGPLTTSDGNQGTVCYSIDSAALVVLAVLGSTSTDQAALLVRQAIGAVEH